MAVKTYKWYQHFQNIKSVEQQLCPFVSKITLSVYFVLIRAKFRRSSYRGASIYNTIVLLLESSWWIHRFTRSNRKYKLHRSIYERMLNKYCTLQTQSYAPVRQSQMKIGAFRWGLHLDEDNSWRWWENFLLPIDIETSVFFHNEQLLWNIHYRSIECLPDLYLSRKFTKMENIYLPWSTENWTKTQSLPLGHTKTFSTFLAGPTALSCWK